MFHGPEMSALIAKQIANTMYTTKSIIPLAIRNELFGVLWFDPYSMKTESFWKMIVLEYLKILHKKMDFKFIKSYEVVDERIKCRIWQHEFQLEGADFTATTMTVNPYPSHPLSALVDCIFSYGVKSGCERCGFHEDGCEGCGFNKARKLINESKVASTFGKTGYNFFDALGEERSNSLMELVQQFNLRLGNMHQGEDEEMDEWDSDIEMKEPLRFLVDEEEVEEQMHKEFDEDESES